MIGQPFNPAECCFLLNQSLNANQFDPNVPNTDNLIPHNLLWNFVENKLQWVNTRDNLIAQELGAGTSIVWPQRNVITVDGVFGNDALAGVNPYSTEYAFKTPEAAVAAAQSGDIIVVNPAIYYITSQLAKNGVNWYFNNGAIAVIPSTPAPGGSLPPAIFKADNMAFNVYGYGTFVTQASVTPTFLITNNSNVNITCSQIIGAANTFAFFQGVYVESNSICNFTSFGIVDCSVNLGYVFFCDVESKLTVNAPEVRFSWIGYSCGTNSELIVNVPKTVSYNYAGDFTGFASSHTLMANGVSDAIIKIYGDLFSANDNDPGPIERVSAALNIRAVGRGCEIHIIGNKSVTRGLRAICVDTASSKIFVNTDIDEMQGDGVYLKRGLVFLNRRLTTPANPQIASGTPVFGLEIGGNVVLNGAVLINGNGGPSIDGTNTNTNNMNYQNYQGAANTPPVNATEIVGNPLIVSPQVI